MYIDANNMNNYGGYSYNDQSGAGVYATKHSSTLTPEEYARLVKQDTPFSLALTELDVLRAVCNHRKLDGTGDALTQGNDGSVRCEVCGYEFIPVDSTTSKEDITGAVAVITDILQTIKLLFIDMPADAQREYFQIIPLIAKVPDLFDYAVKNFRKHENNNFWSYKGANMGTMNLFNMLSGVLNGNTMGPQVAVPPMGTPMGAAPMGTPVGAFGTGVPNPNMWGQPNPNNPYANPAAQFYQPQTSGYSFVPTPAPTEETEEERKKREEEEKKKRVEASVTFKP